MVQSQAIGLEIFDGVMQEETNKLEWFDEWFNIAYKEATDASQAVSGITQGEKDFVYLQMSEVIKSSDHLIVLAQFDETKNDPVKSAINTFAAQINTSNLTHMSVAVYQKNSNVYCAMVVGKILEEIKDDS